MIPELFVSAARLAGGGGGGDDSVASELTQDTLHSMPPLVPMTMTPTPAVTVTTTLLPGHSSSLALGRCSDSDDDEEEEEEALYAPPSQKSANLLQQQQQQQQHQQRPTRMVAPASSVVTTQRGQQQQRRRAAPHRSRSSGGEEQLRYGYGGRGDAASTTITRSTPKDQKRHQPQRRTSYHNATGCGGGVAIQNLALLQQQQQQQKSKTTAMAVAGGDGGGGDDGYGTDNESVVSARSMQRRASIQQRRASATAMMTMERRGSATTTAGGGGAGLYCGSFDDPDSPESRASPVINPGRRASCGGGGGARRRGGGGGAFATNARRGSLNGDGLDVPSTHARRGSAAGFGPPPPPPPLGVVSSGDDNAAITSSSSSRRGGGGGGSKRQQTGGVPLRGAKRSDAAATRALRTQQQQQMAATVGGGPERRGVSRLDTDLMIMSQQKLDPLSSHQPTSTEQLQQQHQDSQNALGLHSYHDARDNVGHTKRIMPQRRRGSTGITPATTGYARRDMGAGGLAIQHRASHGRRASTGHIMAPQVLGTQQQKYKSFACPPTPPQPSKKMGRRASANDASNRLLDDQVPVPVTPEAHKVWHRVSAVNAVATTVDVPPPDDEDYGYGAQYHAHAHARSSGRKEQPSNPAQISPSKTVSPAKKRASAADRMKARCVAAPTANGPDLDGSGSDESAVDLETSQAVLYGTKGDTNNSGSESDNVSQTSSMNSARRAHRRNSAFVGMEQQQDPLSASLLNGGAPRVPDQDMLFPDEESDQETTMLDIALGNASGGAKAKRNTSATLPLSHDVIMGADHVDAAVSGVGVQNTPQQVTTPQNISAPSRPMLAEKETDAAWGRPTPFTTPHVTLTKNALEQKARAEPIPIEAAISKVVVPGHWGDLHIQSSEDSSSRSDECGERMYQDSKTMKEFDRYKQRPRRRSSIDKTFMNMKEMIEQKSPENPVPGLKPAAHCTNASDHIVRAFAARLRAGVTVVKHNRSRWSKSQPRELFLLPDGKTLSWRPLEGEEDKRKRPRVELVKCLEVRHAWSRDPDTRKQLGTSVLRKRCKNGLASKSFSLIFHKRNLDMTALSSDSCKMLMEGFSALCFRLQLERMNEQEHGPGSDLCDVASRRSIDDDDWASTIYGETTASLTQSNSMTNKSNCPPAISLAPWGL